MREGPIVVREWEEADAAAVAEQANDRRVWLGRRFIAMARAMMPRTYFAIEVEERLAGGIGYTLHSDVERIGAEVGYWLGREFWELQRLWAVPYATNAASARVLEKAGYVREGTLRRSAIKDGRILDQWMYAILRVS